MINIKEVVSEWEIELKKEILKLPTPPVLAVVSARGYSEDSTRYINNKRRACERLGVVLQEHFILWEGKTPQQLHEELEQVISRLNFNPCVNGIICQLPYPDVSDRDIADMIHPSKDVDGFSTKQIGLLATNDNRALVPCTALGVMKILKHVYGDLSGKSIVIVNRSNLIGKPLFQLALQENMTPSIHHTKTKHFDTLQKLNADIVVTGCGQRKIFIGRDFSIFPTPKEITIIDCSMTTKPGELGVGDLDKENVMDWLCNANVISGYNNTGLTTVYSLMENTVKAYKLQQPKEIINGSN